MQKKLLMLNASEHEIPFILAARKLGFFVVTTSIKSDYAGHKYADQYIAGNYNDYDEMIALVKRENISAISQACTDDCALSAAYVGERCGLKGHDTYENACIIHRKDKFKEFALRNTVMTPLSKSYTSIKDALSIKDSIDYPYIIKPADLAGGQGIKIANNGQEYIECVSVAFKKSKEKRIVVEPFVQGTLHSLNTFIVDQKVRSYCVANDYSYLNKYLTNTGLSPANDWQEAIRFLIPETERIASLLGLVDGQLHMQFIMHNGKPIIIEMMRRNIGNNWMTMLTDSIGVNWPEWVIRAEAGMDCHLIPKQRQANGYFGYHMVMGYKNGIFKKIEIEPDFQKYVYQYTQWVEQGHEITNFMNEKMGNLVFHFPTDEEKNIYLPHINELVHVVYEDLGY